MKIAFPPERTQPPPHGTRREIAVARPVVRAIAHPDAIKIVRPPPIVVRASASPIAPHPIEFDRVRPPPGTVAVEQPPRATVRAIVHADAARPSPPHPLVERRVTSPIAPHRIAFAAPIASPHKPAG